MAWNCRRTHAALAIAVTLMLGACGSGGPSIAPSGAPPGTATAGQPSVAPSTTASSAVAGPLAARGATLVGPTGLVFDAAGNLYVSGCTWTLSYIYRIDPKGMLTTIAGAGATEFSGDGGPAIAANLQCPVGMAFGPDGALYFADHASNRIRRIDAAGIITTVAGSGAPGVDQGSFSGDGGPATKATLQEPWSIAFDRAGDLFIGDRDNYRVRRVDLKGVITTIAGTGTSLFSGDGGPATAAGMCPHGVLVDAAGNVLIADPCGHRIRKVDSHGAVSTIAGTGQSGFSGDDGPATSAKIDGPDFPALDGAGGFLIQADVRIRRIDKAGVITTIAGIGKTGEPDDGMAALRAPFVELYGLAVDAAGNVYAADGNAKVYRIDPAGVLTVFAGPLH